jgi:hypothetical protein
VTGVSADAAGEIPLHVLERVVAMPYQIQDGVLRVAVADPQNVNAIDELKLATRLPVELTVASREDILAEVRRMARAAEAFGARALLEAEETEPELAEEAEGDDLEVEDLDIESARLVHPSGDLGGERLCHVLSPSTVLRRAVSQLSATLGDPVRSNQTAELPQPPRPAESVGDAARAGRLVPPQRPTPSDGRR